MNRFCQFASRILRLFRTFVLMELRYIFKNKNKVLLWSRVAYVYTYKSCIVIIF